MLGDTPEQTVLMAGPLDLRHPAVPEPRKSRRRRAADGPKSRTSARTAVRKCRGAIDHLAVTLADTIATVLAGKVLDAAG